VAAAIPATLYYIGLYCMVDLESVKQGLKGSPREQLPRAWQVLKEGWHLIIPVGILLYSLIVLGSSMSRAGLLATASIIICSWFRKKTRIGFTQFIQALQEGALSTVGIAAICAVAGIIVVWFQSGLESVSGHRFYHRRGLFIALILTILYAFRLRLPTASISCLGCRFLPSKLRLTLWLTSSSSILRAFRRSPLQNALPSIPHAVSQNRT
jgi:TRAP-type uncharacterized transport system fused permease subunit